MINILKNAFTVMAVAGVMASAPRIHASVIDLGERDLPTPLGGQTAAAAYIEMDQGLAPGTLVYLNKFDYDDGFENNGAVDSSHFDATLLNGGIDADVSWDLATSGFQLSYVFLKDGRESRTGPYLYHLYGVTPDEVFNSMGDQFVTINGQRLITYIAFYGVPGSPSSVPEGGTTLLLLGFGLCAVEMTRKMLLRGSARA